MYHLDHYYHARDVGTLAPRRASEAAQLHTIITRRVTETTKTSLRSFRPASIRSAKKHYITAITHYSTLAEFDGEKSRPAESPN